VHVLGLASLIPYFVALSSGASDALPVRVPPLYLTCRVLIHFPACRRAPAFSPPKKQTVSGTKSPSWDPKKM